MKAATKRILCYILLCLFVLTTITASLTFGRYTSEKASDNDYKGDIEYILGDAIIINTIDDFFQAIENGYSNIQLGDELDNPLIISGGMSGVVSDLTIDLNGHEIQRNNREPILDVKKGINLTIIDTSAKKTGSLYNPVGSVLKVSGGTLTAAAGIFESGPRSGKRDNKGGRVETGSNYNEYAVAKGDTVTWSAHSGGEFNSQADIKDVQLFKNPLSDSEESGSVKYDKEGTALLPIITPKMNTGTNLAVNGNMYFDSGVGVNIGNGIITDDTYLYYTFESENMQFTSTAASGSADYYYQYYVIGDTDGTVNFGYADNQDEKKTESDARVLVTVYVYNNVKGSANKDKRYAAINMASGNLYARAGYYYSYFGKEDTYCVDATGGYMAVTQGQFNAFGKGVGIQCAYDSEAEANEYLNISRGDFYSEVGDTIRVSGGKLEIGTAKIEKDATDSAVKVDWFANGSAINVSGGDVTVNNSLAISVAGSGCAGIRSDGAGAVTANKNCDITLTGDQNVGIYSGKPSGGTSQPVITQPVIIGSQSSGAVTANITLNGEHSYGIYSAGGDVNIAGGGGTVEFDIESKNSGDAYSRAIYAEGGKIDIGTSGETYATFYLDGNNVQGINVDGGNVNICTANNAASTATFNLGQNASIKSSNISGILTSSDSGVESAVVIGSTSSKFALNATGTAMSGIYARGGSISLFGKVDFTLNSRGGAEGAGIAGIYSEGGSVTIGAEGTQNIAEFDLSGGYLRGISVSGSGSSATFNGETIVNMADGIKSSYGIAASQGTLTFNNSVNITAQGASNTVYGIYTNAGTIDIDSAATDIGSVATITFAENYTANTAYGIYATGAGSVVDIGGTTTITYSGKAENSNGIHNVGGTVAISATTTITFSGGAKDSNGIYNGADAEQGIDGGKIGLGYQLTESGIEAVESSTVEFKVDLTAATGSTGIYSAGGTINISGSKYTSTISESTGTDLDNASIYATAGEVNFAASGEDGVTLTSDCLGIVIRGTLNFDSGNVDITTLNGTAIYVYQGSLTADEDVAVDIESGINGKGWGVEGAESQTNIYNGVFVNGGSLIASGTFNVTHTGVKNDPVGSGMNTGITPDYEYRDFKIKSFAVRVEGAAGTVVQLNAGTLQNAVGGGLYVSGGTATTVTLGNENSQQGDISITTYGTSYSGDYTVAGHENSNWHAPVPITGGHAVQVNGGSLTIHNGTYQSALGNGILVSNGTATIYDGKFDGTDYTATVGGVAGAAANYGFKMYGGKVEIYNGAFSEGKSGSGAFVMGTGPGTNVAQANIYGGSFDVNGQAGFSVYQYAKVTFDKKDDSNVKITVKGLGAGLAIETTPNGGAPTVTINAGEFSSKSTVNDGSGVWYGNGGATLTITGGQFTGTSKSGLWIDKDPGTNIQLSGGIYEGKRADRAYGVGLSYPYYKNGGAIGANASIDWRGDSDGAVVYKKDFIVAGFTVYGENGGTGAFITNDNDTIHENIMGYSKITISRQA